jgi:hypothetical protein
MSDTRTIKDKQGNPLQIEIASDRRLRRSARWVRQNDGSILLRVPHKSSERDIERMLQNIERRLAKMRSPRHIRTDEDLQERAAEINKKCFGGELAWTSIRWVGNMEHRLGSCTTGGLSDGAIRLSERIREWPSWVVDYVIAHELAHRKYPNHSAAFWDFLKQAYPLTDQAIGFVKGVGFATNEELQDD